MKCLENGKVKKSKLNALYTKCIQVGYKVDTQIRLDKSSIYKKRIVEVVEDKMGNNVTQMLPESYSDVTKTLHRDKENRDKEIEKENRNKEKNITIRKDKI